MTHVDFKHIRSLVSIEQAIDWLGLEGKRVGEQWRGLCPINGGERALVVTPSKQLFYCFAPGCAAGGDVIELVAKVRQVSTRDAALALQNHFVSVDKKVGTADNPFQPLDYLDASHSMVKELGFDEPTARALGIGYAPRGIMRGRVAIPVRNAKGKLCGYVGINPALDPPVKLPSTWHL